MGYLSFCSIFFDSTEFIDSCWWSEGLYPTHPGDFLTGAFYGNFREWSQSSLVIIPSPHLIPLLSTSKFCMRILLIFALKMTSMWGTHEIEIVTEIPEIEKRPAALPSWRMLAFLGRRYDRTGKPCGAQSRKNRTNCYREYTFWFHTKRFLENKPCSEYAIDSKSKKVV